MGIVEMLSILVLVLYVLWASWMLKNRPYGKDTDKILVIVSIIVACFMFYVTGNDAFVKKVL